MAGVRVNDDKSSVQNKTLIRKFLELVFSLGDSDQSYGPRYLGYLAESIGHNFREEMVNIIVIHPSFYPYPLAVPKQMLSVCSGNVI